MKIRKEKNKLYIELDLLDENIAPISKSSGKNKVLFTTGGFTASGDDTRLAINVLKPVQLCK